MGYAISTDNKFIFCHIPKTGGSSIESFLNRRYGEGSVKGYLDFDSRMTPHPTSMRLKSFLKGGNDYFIFAFIRNPWDREVSKYFYSTERYGLRKSFNSFLEEQLRNKKKLEAKGAYFKWHQRYSFYNCYYDDMLKNGKGEITVSFIGRFEHLELDLKTVLDAIGVSGEDCRLGRHRATKHLPYIEYYDQKGKDMVSSLYKNEIDFWGFGFESPATKNIGLIGE